MTTESFRKDVSRQLTELKTAPAGAEPISMPANLSSVERKYVHAQAP